MKRFLSVRNVKMMYRIFIKSKLVINPYTIYCISQYYASMNQGNVKRAMSVVLRIQKHGVSYFLFAHHAYFLGQYQTAISNLEKMLEKFPNHPESSYLLSQCLVKEDRIDEALSLLYRVLNCSNRKKTWLYLSNVVSTYQQFIAFDKAFALLPDSKLRDKNLLTYYSDAAVKVGAYDYAIQQWKKGINFIQENNIIQQPIQNFFSTECAAESLLQCKKILDHNKVSFFLVSGTLLGCVRDREILPFDKDLDIGIWEEEISLEKLIDIFCTSGCFEVMPIKTRSLLKLKHINGSFIDVFIHQKDEKENWHATSKLKWINTNFQLVEKDFLGEIFYIPQNYDLYLNENYGEDWRCPKPTFDSTFDTPNAVVLNQNELKVYLYRKAYESYLYANGLEMYFFQHLNRIEKI